MVHFVALLEQINTLLWNHCLFILLTVVGILYTVRLRGVQFRHFASALKLTLSKGSSSGKGDISQFQSLMTALAATIGIASIAGVSTAIVAGGFGSIFWMWVIALIGMATKFAEAILAVKFREQDKNGGMCGGPMYYIEKGLKMRWLGIAFAFFGAIASFAGGNLIQSHSIAHAITSLSSISPHWVGIILAILTFLALMHGIQTIGKVSAVLVPVMATLYLVAGITIIALNISAVPAVLALIVKSAFTGQAAGGGFLGASVMMAIRYGIARGISSSEAGLGSAPIASAAAKTEEPGTQALISMIGTFISVILVCTVTALVIGVTGVLGTFDIHGDPLNGVALVMAAFKQVIPRGDLIVALGVLLFGYSTIIGWAYYGEKCVEYLLHERSVIYFRAIFCIVVYLGAIMHLNIVWPIVDLTNGLMALPNLLALFGLSKLVSIETKHYFSQNMIRA